MPGAVLPRPRFARKQSCDRAFSGVPPAGLLRDRTWDGRLRAWAWAPACSVSGARGNVSRVGGAGPDLVASHRSLHARPFLSKMEGAPTPLTNRESFACAVRPPSPANPLPAGGQSIRSVRAPPPARPPRQRKVCRRVTSTTQSNHLFQTSLYFSHRRQQGSAPLRLGSDAFVWPAARRGTRPELAIANVAKP